MVNIIGLGSFSCEVADLFSSPQYKSYKIDFDLDKTRTTRVIIMNKSPEKIEEKCTSMNYLLKIYLYL